jgi:hypothetical protein
MAFKQTQPAAVSPDSPAKILLDLPRRKIPSVLHHQGEVIRQYVEQAVGAPDVALQLPTGSGKTLVGLLIAEWRRRKFGERAVYLCPNNQLVHQVVEQATEHYGLNVHGFTGPISEYAPGAKADYQSADRLAITNYSSLFNTNPYFNNAGTIIVDDAHAAENYIASLWTVRVDRSTKEHAALHTALAAAIKPHVAPTNYARLVGYNEREDHGWVEKLPTPTLFNLANELGSILDVHASVRDIGYPWSMLRDHLKACNLYLTCQEILLRPLIPPTWTHAPFVAANQRIYMSATLGDGGDLERLTGRREIKRLPIPPEWDRHGIGRRYFVFPSFSLRDEETVKLRHELMKVAGRSLVLVPSMLLREEIVSDVATNLQFPVFAAEDIERSKRPFVQQPHAVAVVANRYDGIDFPNDDCRLLFIDGLPRAMNAQERFIMSRMGANVLYNERVQTRVLQAIGRCTRSLQDYSAVVVSGDELPDYLNDRNRRTYLHPELQAELEFGIEQSKGTTVQDLVDNVKIFLSNGEEWEEANKDILAKRDTAKRAPFPTIAELQAVVGLEVEYQSRIWQGDYEGALSAAESVLGGLAASELRGYRALWHYLAGSAAWLGAKDGASGLDAKSKIHYVAAKEAAPAVAWLVNVARSTEAQAGSSKYVGATMEQVERLEPILASFGTLHDWKFSRREKEILDGLGSSDRFEHAHQLLGELLGFETGKVETDASPDPWWICGDICFVFEDHAGAQATGVLDATKARQVATHPNWMREKELIGLDSRCLPVLITPVTKAKAGAVPHLHGVALWSLEEFRNWAHEALSVVRELRRNFSEPGDLAWRARAAETFENAAIDSNSLYLKLRASSAAGQLQVVP